VFVCQFAGKCPGAVLSVLRVESSPIIAYLLTDRVPGTGNFHIVDIELHWNIDSSKNNFVTSRQQ
jgi:hypothetical protein